MGVRFEMVHSKKKVLGLGLAAAAFFISALLVAGVAIGGDGGLADDRIADWSGSGSGGIVAASSVTSDINYQGLLTDSSGNPLPTGFYTMTFRLYEVSSGGTALETIIQDVYVDGGLFNTTLAFNPAYFDGRVLWLGIKAGSDPEMTPRQELRSVPYALSLRPGAVINGSLDYSMLKVENSAGPAVYGYSSEDVGVYGEGKEAGGYFTTTAAGTNTNPKAGVNISTLFDWNPGVLITTNGSCSSGVLVRTSGNYSAGIIAQTSGKFASAVHALGTGLGSTGVSGESDDIGVCGRGFRGGLFKSSDDFSWVSTFPSWGVYAITDYDNSPGVAVLTYGAGSRGVNALTIGPASPGVYAYTSGYDSPAIYGESYRDDGVIGIGKVGVNGTGTGTSGIGVSGYADHGWGIYGFSQDGFGVVGKSPAGKGVYGDGLIYGVVGTSPETGVIGDTSRADHMYGVRTPDYMKAARYDTGSSDVAEYLPVVDGVLPGTVLIIGATGTLEPSSAAYDIRVAGIVSTEPGMALGTREGGNSGEALIAVAGRVPCKVDASYGTIHPGDLLTTSPTLGHAMKAQPVNIGGVEIYRPGTIIGKAMEPLNSGTGLIEVFVTLL